MGKGHQYPNYKVHWKARVLTPDKTIRQGLICEVRQGGFGLEFDQILGLGTDVSIEFYVKFRNKDKRIRAKTRITHCVLLSDNRGSLLRLSTKEISPEDNHTINNILQVFGESKEFNLQL